MPSLRELFLKINPVFRDDAAYAFLESLLETVELLVEAVESEDTDATIHKLRVEFWAERRKLECEVQDGRKELTEAKVEITRVRAGLLDTICGVQLERDEAKAEIQRLYLNAASEWHTQARQAYETKYEELTEAKVEIERLRPLAELGELVLGMQSTSRLTRWHTEYTVEKAENYIWKRAGPRPDWSIGSPAEALRAIQASE